MLEDFARVRQREAVYDCFHGKNVVVRADVKVRLSESKGENKQALRE